MTGRSARLAALAAGAWGIASPAAAQPAPETDAAPEERREKSVRAPLVESLPNPDGRLDEPVWETAARIRGFTQSEPTYGEPATLPTEVLIAYTPEGVMVGARLDDPAPDAVVAREYRRDANLDSDDNFMVVFDTYHDHRSAFFFTTNAVGTRQDGLVQGEGAYVNTEWDGVWTVASRRTDRGWVTEMVIPFETLRFPAGASEFGVNFGRRVARTREESYWAPIDPGWGFNAQWRVSAYGGLTGMERAEPGGRVKLKPFGVLGLSDGEEAEREVVPDLGLDAKIALSSNLNLDLTLNTDFAQVEADEQQVNLTRFELFFPEKREFFLENAGLFEVGERTRPFDPRETALFFSRRIGLSSDGDILPILGGARVTGKVGATDVGAFHIRQEALDGELPAVGYTAARLRRDVLARSSVGVLALDRTEIGGESHRVAAADFSWAPHRATTISGFGARSWTPGAEGRESVWGLHGETTTDLWNLTAAYTDIGEGFESKMGFVPRTGVRKVRAGGLWKPRPGRFGIRQVFFGPDYLRFTRPDGSVQSETIGVGPFFLFNDGSNLFFSVERSVEGLSESFELRDGVEIAAGEYRAGAVLYMVDTSQSRRVSFNLFGMNRGFFGGRLNVYSPGVAFRPHPRIRLQVNYSRSEVRLPQENGDFDTNLIVLRGLIALSPDAFVRGLLQWNDDDGNFSGNVQLRWTYAPGSDFFLVYNERRPFGSRASDPSRREVLAKATWYWTPG